MRFSGWGDSGEQRLIQVIEQVAEADGEQDGEGRVLAGGRQFISVEPGLVCSGRSWNRLAGYR